MERTIICSCRGFTNHKKCFHVENLEGAQAAREQEVNVCPQCKSNETCDEHDVVVQGKQASTTSKGNKDEHEAD